MNNLKNLVLLIFISTILISCKQGSSDNSSTKISIETKSTKITDSKEFESYFLKFFNLSDKNTKTDLPYVNKFMEDKKLLPFKDLCGLLINDTIKSDERVYNFWKKRCEFNKAKEKLMRKYQIDGDSIKILMQEAIKEGKYNEKLK